MQVTELEPGVQIGGYEIVEEIGRGQFGLRAYLARHRLVDRMAVVTLCFAQDEAVRALVQRSAHILASISHPHLVGLYDAGEYQGIMYQVHEYVSGSALATIIESGDHLPLTTVVQLMTNIADALDYLHGRGYVHGEVQPSNIIVSTDGVPVLLSSLTLSAPAEDAGPDGMVLGPAPYLPPEAWQGKSDERSDLWALGMTLCFLLVGEVPLGEADRVEAREAILSAVPLDFHVLDEMAPEPLARIVRRCVEKDLTRRYQSAADVRRDLESAQAFLESQRPGTSAALLEPGRTIWLNVEYVEAKIPGRFREYRIEREVGAGMFSTVYAARDVIGDRPVALKILRRDRADQDTVLARFQREAALLARLRHPNIVEVFNYGRYAGDHFIVMQLLENTTLEMAMEGRSVFAVEEAVAVASQILGGLEALHAGGVVHRDLKPANVILAPDRAVVMDLGLARVTEGSTLTTLGQILGTPRYMAPEQARGDTVTAQSDLYAAAVMLFEMLTGETPHRAASAGELLFKIAVEPPESVTQHRQDLPRALVSFLDRALAREPGSRHRSALSAREELLTSIGLENDDVERVYGQVRRESRPPDQSPGVS